MVSERSGVRHDKWAQSAQGLAGDASARLAALNNLYSSLGGLQSALNGYRGQVASSLSSVQTSLSLVAGYLRSGQELGPQAVAMIEKQVATAVAERVAANLRNTATQGCTVGDPVLVASGFESFTEEDYSYKSINDVIRIARQFRSNKTELVSSFGTSWFFNYDTNVVAGRKPHIKEREILTAELKDEAQRLADLAVEAMNNALAALETAQSAALSARETSNQIASVRSQISSLSSQISSLASQAQAAANTASSNAGVAGTDDAASDAAAAASAASSAAGSASAATGKASSADTIANQAADTAAAAENDVVTAQGLVIEIREKERRDPGHPGRTSSRCRRCCSGSQERGGNVSPRSVSHRSHRLLWSWLCEDFHRGRYPDPFPGTGKPGRILSAGFRFRQLYR